MLKTTKKTTRRKEIEKSKKEKKVFVCRTENSPCHTRVTLLLGYTQFKFDYEKYEFPDVKIHR